MSTNQDLQSVYYIQVDDKLRDKDHQYQIGINEGEFHIKLGMLPDVTHNGTYFEKATTICKIHLPLTDPEFKSKKEWENFKVNKFIINPGEQYKICDDNTWNPDGIDHDHRGPFILNHALKYGNLKELEYVIPRLGSRSLSHGFIYAGDKIHINAIHWLQEHYPHLLRQYKPLTFDTPERLKACLETGLSLDLISSIRKQLDPACLDILHEHKPELLKKYAEDIINNAIYNNDMIYIDWFMNNRSYEIKPSYESIKSAFKLGFDLILKWLLDNPEFQNLFPPNKIIKNAYSHFLNGRFNMFDTLYQHSSIKDDAIKYFADQIENNEVLKTYFQHHTQYPELHQLAHDDYNCSYCS